MGTDALDIFQSRLEKEGIDATVSKRNRPTRQADIYRVKTEINGEIVRFDRQVTYAEKKLGDQTEEKRIKTEAEVVVRMIRERTQQHLEWKKKAVAIDHLDTPTITCKYCGAEASLGDLDRRVPMLAETTAPNPRTNDELDLPRAKENLVLQALLVDECEDCCRDSPTGRFKW